MANSKLLTTKYLLIGNSAGGIGAAEAIREVDKAGSITIVSDEPYPAYSRPLISEYLAGHCSLEKMLFRPPGFCRQHNIVTLLGHGVKHLRLEQRTAEMEGDKTIAWEKLLLASGGKPIVPRIEGMAKKGVFTFTTLDDAKAIEQFLAKAQKAVVIGGGLIGVSVTEALAKRWVKVSVVEMKELLLNTILDEFASLMAEEALRQAGVEIITGHTVAQIKGGESVEAVVLDNGEQLATDMVVVAIGVSPRTELVFGTKIKVNRGIVVDRHMATSYPDVYACGDVAEAHDFVYGENRLTPIWPNAYLGGRIAGYNMAGVSTEYPGGTAMNSLKYFGQAIVSAGLVIPPDDKHYEMLTRRKDGVYRKVVLHRDRLVGMVFVGDIEKSGIVFALMRKRVNVADFKDCLVADDFGLAYFPLELREQWLEMPHSAAQAVAVGS